MGGVQLGSEVFGTAFEQVWNGRIFRWNPDLGLVPRGRRICSLRAQLDGRLSRVLRFRLCFFALQFS
jgi:hypothetical protein